MPKENNKAVPPPPSTSADQSKRPVNANSNITVFISNLDFAVDVNKIIAVFEKEPGFKEVRLPSHYSGKNKGFGYVDFETPVSTLVVSCGH